MRHPSSLLLIATLAAACSEGTTTAATPAPPPPAASSISAPWVAVRPARGHALLEAPARVLDDPGSYAELAAPTRLRVLAVRVAPGDRVAVGAPLLDVAYPDAATAAAAWLAAADQLAAQTARRAQLELLRKDGLARVSELTAVEVELARLRGDRDVAAATLRAAGLDPGNARGLVDGGGRGTLRAPIAGVVTKVDAAIGQARGPDAPALIAIARAGASRIEASLARPLPAGAALRFTPSGGAPLAVRLVELEPRATPDGTRRGWFVVEPADAANPPLRAGQPGRLEATVADDAVVIPAEALIDDKAVWIRDGASSRQVAVTLLARSGGDAIVRGLPTNAEVRARATERP